MYMPFEIYRLSPLDWIKSNFSSSTFNCISWNVYSTLYSYNNKLNLERISLELKFMVRKLDPLSK